MIFEESEYKKQLRAYEETKRRIQKATVSLIPRDETPAQQAKRKEVLLADFEKFAKYYFPTYCQCDFGWFHRKFIKTVTPNELTVLRWFRGSAKSVFATILFPMLKYYRGELGGMALASATADKAAMLMRDIQVQFESNELLIHDFGSRVGFGSWTDGYFSTSDSCGFWSLGLGQSPRGIREGAKRPTYFLVDDGDSKARSKNPQLVKEAVDWIQEDFFRAADITENPIFVVANNRYSKNTIVAHIVGDVEAGDLKRPDVNCIDAFAIENPRTHARAELDDPDSRPSWSRFTKQHWYAVVKTSGERAFRREDQMEDLEEGDVFKHDWFKWGKRLPISKFGQIVCYLDPSYKASKNSDTKAIAVVGQYYDASVQRYRKRLLNAWVKVATKTEMVKAMYELYDLYGDKVEYWMEANFIQDEFKEDFVTEGNERGYQLPLKLDKQKKDDKDVRIENLTPDFERGDIDFCETQRGNVFMIRGIDQFKNFPNGKKDFPDAVHGAFSKLKRLVRSSNFKPRGGKFNKPSKRG